MRAPHHPPPVIYSALRALLLWHCSLALRQCACTTLCYWSALDFPRQKMEFFTVSRTTYVGGGNTRKVILNQNLRFLDRLKTNSWCSNAVWPFWHLNTPWEASCHMFITDTPIDQKPWNQRNVLSHSLEPSFQSTSAESHADGLFPDMDANPNVFSTNMWMFLCKHHI